MNPTNLPDNDAMNPRPADDGITDGVIEPGQSQIQPLAQDYSTPFSEPTDSADEPGIIGEPEARNVPAANPTHQIFDAATDIDAQERYDAGSAVASGYDANHDEQAVVGYDPAKDQRRHDAGR